MIMIENQCVIFYSGQAHKQSFFSLVFEIIIIYEKEEFAHLF